MPEQPYADPQDLQFGKAAAEKEEELDELLEQGESLEQVTVDEETQRQHGALTEPRAGNKAPLPEDR